MNEIVNVDFTNQLVKLDPFAAQLAKFKKQYAGVVYDLDDPAQDKQARSDRLAIGKVISKLDETHKSIKEPLLELTRLVDGKRKEIKDELLAVQGKIKDQIEAHEAKKAAHEEALQQKVEAIRALAVFDGFAPDSQLLTERLSAAKAMEIDDTYEHRKADAALAQMEVTKQLTQLLNARLAHEKEQAELERLRQQQAERERKEREDRIAQEAAEAATKAAEAKAEAERKAAIAKAEQDKKAAADKAEAARLKLEREKREAEERAENAAKAEREKIAKEQAEAAAKAEIARKEEEAKKAKQQHRAKIHGAAKKSLIAVGLDDATATLVVEAIRDHAVAHVFIEY